MTATPPVPEPMLNLGSPRVQAAMQVLGIETAELQPKSPPRIASEEDRISAEVRYDMLERKRRMLVHGVARLAERTKAPPKKPPPSGTSASEASGESGQTNGNGNGTGHGGGIGAAGGASNAYLDDVLSRERANLEKLRERAQKDVQKHVLKELAAKQQADLREQKQEEARQRVAVFRKRRDEELAAKKKEADKRAADGFEKRLKVEREREDEAKELARHIDRKTARAETILANRSHEWDEHRIKGQEQLRKAQERLAMLNQQGWQVRNKQYQALNDRHRRRMDRMVDLEREKKDTHDNAYIRERISRCIENARAVLAAPSSPETATSNSAASAERIKAMRRLRDALAFVQTGLETARSLPEPYMVHELEPIVKQLEERYEEECDTAYDQRLQLQDQAQQVRSTNAQELQKYFLDRNRKEAVAHRERHNRFIQQKTTPKVRRHSMSDGAIGALAKQRSEISERHAATAKTTVELISLNREQLRRAHKFAQEQALNRIETIRHRVQVMNDSKDQAAQRRLDMMKNVAIEKEHLTRQVEKVRDAPIQKMNKILAQLDLPPIKAGKEENEEAEATRQ